MASPQSENGHVKISNELLEAFSKANLTGSEFRIVLYIIRKTYGWNKKSDYISLSQFSDNLKMSRVMVCRTIKKLVYKNILGSIKNDTPPYNIPTNYSIQKDYDKWLGGSIQKDTSIQAYTKGSIQTVQKVVYKRIHTKDNTKDNINTMSCKHDLTAPIRYLNTVAKTNFSLKAKSNLNLVKTRFNEDYTFADFKIVIDRKCEQWLKDPKMCQYIRPKTLFSPTNFESYLNEKTTIEQEKRKLVSWNDV